jgi:hypothetical protein
METLYIVVNIGCIECGVSSDIVGVFDNKEAADEACAYCTERYKWRGGGQNEFEVFKFNSSNMNKNLYKSDNG